MLYDSTYGNWNRTSFKGVDDFLTHCELQALKCNFCHEQEVNEPHIGDTQDPKLQKELLSKDNNLTLDQATELRWVHEASIQHMHQLSSVQAVQSDIYLWCVWQNQSLENQICIQT